MNLRSAVCLLAGRVSVRTASKLLFSPRLLCFCILFFCTDFLPAHRSCFLRSSCLFKPSSTDSSHAANDRKLQVSPSVPQRCSQTFSFSHNWETFGLLWFFLFLRRCCKSLFGDCYRPPSLGLQFSGSNGSKTPDFIR